MHWLSTPFGARLSSRIRLADVEFTISDAACLFKRAHPPVGANNLFSRERAHACRGGGADSGAGCPALACQHGCTREEALAAGPFVPKIVVEFERTFPQFQHCNV